MRNATNTYVNNLLDEGYVYTMKQAGFSARLMKAPKLKDVGTPHSLPPGSELPVVPIANLPGCPDLWSREAGTYVCPVDTNWGIWFDFTMNDRMNTAVVSSIKGLNPITGKPLDGPNLESYVEKCPIHNIPFGHDLLCEECGYRWPHQNYLTHESTLWLDGFRQPDGTVRQFFFTEDDKRDIASLIMGKQNTMPAFGFVFYEPKVKREEPVTPTIFDYASPILDHWNGGGFPHFDDNIVTYTTSTTPLPAQTMSFCANVPTKSTNPDLSCYHVNTRSIKTASVGAGAEINQDIKRDSIGVDGWKEAPSSVIRLYFCFEEQFRQIVERGGVKGIQTKNSGFLNGLPVG